MPDGRPFRSAPVYALVASSHTPDPPPTDPGPDGFRHPPVYRNDKG